MWNELLASIPGLAIAGQPASLEALEAAARSLGHPAPRELAAVLMEAGSVTGEYVLELIWPIERIVTENMALRNDADLALLYMPFDVLLFSGEAGNGDLFGLVPPRRLRLGPRE